MWIDYIEGAIIYFLLLQINFWLAVMSVIVVAILKEFYKMATTLKPNDFSILSILITIAGGATVAIFLR